MTTYPCVFPLDLWAYMLGYCNLSSYATLLRLNKWHCKTMTTNYPFITLINDRYKRKIFGIVSKLYKPLVDIVIDSNSLFAISISDAKRLYRPDMCRGVGCEHLRLMMEIGKTKVLPDSLPDCILFTLGFDFSHMRLKDTIQEGARAMGDKGIIAGLMDTITKSYTTLETMFDDTTMLTTQTDIVAPHMKHPQRLEVVLRYLLPPY